MKTRVVSIVLNNFVNDTRVLNEAISLQRAGYDVTIVALHEDGLAERELVQSVPVHRIRLDGKQWGKKSVTEVFRYGSLAYRIIREYRHAAIFHCNDLAALPIGVFTKLFANRRSKIVYDAHEYETEANGLKGLEKIMRSWLERMLIGNADTVITVSDSIANEYTRLYGIRKPGLVLNCPRFVEVKKHDLFREELGIPADKLIFLYQGVLNAGRGVELLLEAFSDPEGDSVIVFMGFGPLVSEIQERARTINRVYFRAAVEPRVLLRYTSSADYGVALIEDVSLSNRYCLPNKVFEYMMAGVPLLCSDLPEMRRLLEAHGLGVVIPEFTPAGVQRAVADLRAMSYEELVRNVTAARREFNWEAQEKFLLQAYASLGAHAVSPQ